jgi:hypothetical protein
MVVCSDVIYPAGDAEDYYAKFYDPYEGYAPPSTPCLVTTTGKTAWSALCITCAGRSVGFPAAEERASSLKGRLRRLLGRRPAIGSTFALLRHRDRSAAYRWDRIFPLPGSGRGSLHHFFSEFFVWNELPLFKNLFRIDASGEEMLIRCFAATGCAEHKENSPVEDEVRIPLR